MGVYEDSGLTAPPKIEKVLLSQRTRDTAGRPCRVSVCRSADGRFPVLIHRPKAPATVAAPGVAP